MAQTYAQVEKQIAALQAKAERLKRQEVGEVVAKIKKAIAAYGITAQELFGKAVAAKTKAAAKKTKSAGVPKYSDDKGNVWGGMGPRPQWLRDALAGGKQLEDFLTGGDEKGNGVAPAAESGKTAAAKKSAVKRAGKKKVGRKNATAKKPTSTVQYTDGTNKWGGRGPQPRWLKEILASGKTLDDLRVQ
jgi:DNA-binding protein H-NS